MFSFYLKKKTSKCEFDFSLSHEFIESWNLFKFFSLSSEDAIVIATYQALLQWIHFHDIIKYKLVVLSLCNNTCLWRF